MERRSVNNLTLFILTTATTLAVGIGVAIFSAMPAPGVLVASLTGSMAAGASAVVLNTAINLSLRTYDLIQSIKQERIYNEKFNAAIQLAEASKVVNEHDGLQHQRSLENKADFSINLKPERSMDTHSKIERHAGTSNAMIFANDHTPPETISQRDAAEIIHTIEKPAVDKKRYAENSAKTELSL